MAESLPKSSKARKKIKEQNQKERQLRAERRQLFESGEVSAKRPTYRIPERNTHINVSKTPRHSPVLDEVLPLSEEMIERERLAQIEIERKKKCTAPAFNKGPYQYIASEEQAKWVGKK